MQLPAAFNTPVQQTVPAPVTPQVTAPAPAPAPVAADGFGGVEPAALKPAPVAAPPAPAPAPAPVVQAAPTTTPAPFSFEDKLDAQLKPSEAHILYDIGHLTKWWGTKCVSDINSTTCKSYVKHRRGIASARRELAFLGAAVKHWNAEHGPLKAVPVVVLPPAREARSHWMTREQAARFLWEARKKSRHLARFFIIGWYTGTRRAKICGLRWSMVDFKTKIMQRRPPGTPEAKNKKAPPVRMGRRLMAHMRRWKRMDGKKAEFVITYQGKRVKNPIRIWDETRRAAKLPAYITPHILRHTRATNMMQQRKDPWEASKALGMSLEMLTKVYGHHHPDWQKDVSETR